MRPSKLRGGNGSPPLGRHNLPTSDERLGSLGERPSSEQEPHPGFLQERGGQGGILRPTARDFYLAFRSDLPPLYLLPKVHKGVDSTTGSWSGRPVLNGCRALTRPIDWVCTALNPFLSLLDERLVDTTDFLNKTDDVNRTRGPAPQRATLFSLDIVSLYPSIP